MEFRILGPLEVLDGGRLLSIRRGKEQALLAYLLLHANEVVPSARLIDVLWDERPPPTASKVLQNAVSNLRKQLGDGRLATRDPGYLLRVEEGELDLERFERLAKEGRREEALALWRGPPLLDLHDQRFADEARRRLEEQRLAALEERIEDDLAAGRDSELVSELEGLVAEHPLRERLYSQLMLALYRAGRQGDALETFRRARRTLSQELGLEPGPQLQELERNILQQDPALTASAGTGRPSEMQRRSRGRQALLLVLILAAAAAASIYVLTRGDEHAPTVVPNSLVKIDPKTNRIVDVVPVGRRPAAVAMVGRNLWVANSLDDTLTHVDTSSGVTRTLGGFQYPTSLAEDGRTVWVGNNSSGVLVAIDGVSGVVVDRVRIPGAAGATFLAYGEHSIWVSEEEAALHRVNLATGAVTMRMRNSGVHELAFGKGAVWVALGGRRQILRIDANDGTSKRIAVGGLPTGVAFGFGAVWVASSTDDSVWRIDATTGDIDDVVHVGDRPEGVAVAAGSVWVANHNGGTVSRIDPRTNEVVSTVRTGYFPLGLADGRNGVWITVSGAREP
jgi:YVTN family beta-propeller protein